MTSRGEVVRVLAFLLSAVVMLALTAVTVGGFRIQSTTDYAAVFRDASGLADGVDVRAAGVTVGRVRDIALQPDHSVLVSFSVPEDLAVSTATRATVRYKNLIGDRFLDLTQDPRARAAAQDPGTPIPLDRTAPALNLDELFNGFKPLLQGLEPQEVNDLSAALVAVFQGQGGAVESLLSHIGSLTGTLADRDQVIGSLVQDLDTVLGTVDEHRAQFDSTIVELQQLATGLAQDRDRIGDSLTRVAGLADRTASFLDELRPELSGTTEQVKRVSEALNSRSDVLDYNLNQIEPLVRTLGRGGAYGSFFNFHICGIRVMTDLATTPFFLSQEPRCQFYPDSQYDHPDYGLPADWEQRDAAAGEGHR
jgi:phospholipid/cholesterol/gamma-HCH transport system substrate-binding protein